MPKIKMPPATDARGLSEIFANHVARVYSDGRSVGVILSVVRPELKGGDTAGEPGYEQIVAARLVMPQESARNLLASLTKVLQDPKPVSTTPQ
jgi:hypothetical protein